MARPTPSRSVTRTAGATTAPSPTAEKNKPGHAKTVDARHKEGYRETVEAVAFAFILALLVRGFEAEAFVIPTGSMAPTLMGRHKEITCSQCGYLYTINASEEVEGVPSGSLATRRVYTGICVNCRFQARVADAPSFKGDRILVMKFPYDLPFLPGSSGPQRWDVVVFRYPEEPETSYIKRLVGLPGETLRIWYGDVFIKPPGGQLFRQERRPLVHQQAMQMMVNDDSHRPSLLKDRPEWKRWVPSVAGAWTEDDAAPGFYRVSGGEGDWSELRYRHVLPDPQQWRAVETGDPLPRQPRATLVTDFYSYNTNLPINNSDLVAETTRDQESAWMQPHWVGDLTLSAKVESESGSGRVRLELIEGGVANRCEIDLATGEALLSHGETALGRKASPLKGQGKFDVTFANVDNRLTLWVDGRTVFGDGLTYEDSPGVHPEPAAEDLAPARVAVKGAKVSVSGLVLKRDIYYTQNPGYLDYGNSWDARLPQTPVQLFDLLSDPKRVAALGPLGSSDYPVGQDRFMMLGDNSPRSKDSRGWHSEDQEWDTTTNRQKWEVPRSMLTGKAFCIYWPHGKPFGPDIRLQPDLRVPFRPYFERMRLIH